MPKSLSKPKPTQFVLYLGVYLFAFTSSTLLVREMNATPLSSSDKRNLAKCAAMMSPAPSNSPSPSASPISAHLPTNPPPTQVE